jgi:uncharacterized membrane protein YcfT
MNSAAKKRRIDWVDYSKGICIVLVVMMHTTLGVEKSLAVQTWLHPFIEWARPFRMPDFFLISGLFLASRIDLTWKEFVNSKLLHFAYFYVLWMTIQFLLRSSYLSQTQSNIEIFISYLFGFIEPYGTLWFIYLLAIFFAFTKFTKSVPAAIMFALAALLEVAQIETGWTVIDEFASRYVYFYAGFWIAKHVFSFAEIMSQQKLSTLLAGLILWGYTNYIFVHFELAQLPVISLMLGFVGAAAVITSGVLLAKTHFAGFIQYCGANSIVIYLAFSLFMASSRSFILKFIQGMDLGLASLLITGIAVSGPLMLLWGTKGTRLDFLFHRPNWARLSFSKRQWHSEPHAEKLLSKTR